MPGGDRIVIPGRPQHMTPQGNHRGDAFVLADGRRRVLARGQGPEQVETIRSRTHARRPKDRRTHKSK